MFFEKKKKRYHDNKHYHCGGNCPKNTIPDEEFYPDDDDFESDEEEFNPAEYKFPANENINNFADNMMPKTFTIEIPEKIYKQMVSGGAPVTAQPVAPQRVDVPEIGSYPHSHNSDLAAMNDKYIDPDILSMREMEEGYPQDLVELGDYYRAANAVAVDKMASEAQAMYHRHLATMMEINTQLTMHAMMENRIKASNEIADIGRRWQEIVSHLEYEE